MPTVRDPAKVSGHGRILFTLCTRLPFMRASPTHSLDGNVKQNLPAMVAQTTCELMSFIQSLQTGTKGTLQKRPFPQLSQGLVLFARLAYWGAAMKSIPREVLWTLDLSKTL